jgi:hypothetical protein
VNQAINSKAELFAWAMRNRDRLANMPVKDIEAELRAIGKSVSYASEVKTTAQAARQFVRELK